MSFGLQLRNARKSAGMTQAQLAALLGISDSTITSWEKETRQPDIPNIKKLTQILDVSAEYLLEIEKIPVANDDEDDRQMQKLIHNYKALNGVGRSYLVNFSEDLTELQKYTEKDDSGIVYRTIPYSLLPASAGLGEWLDTNKFEELNIPDIPEYSQADFAVRVNGDSMEPDYEDGDIVLIHKQDAINEGDAGLFWVEDKGGVIKRMGHGELISINPKYDRIKYDTNIGRCYGKVIAKLEQ